MHTRKVVFDRLHVKLLSEYDTFIYDTLLGSTDNFRFITLCQTRVQLPWRCFHKVDTLIMAESDLGAEKLSNYMNMLLSDMFPNLKKCKFEMMSNRLVPLLKIAASKYKLQKLNISLILNHNSCFADEEIDFLVFLSKCMKSDCQIKLKNLLDSTDKNHIPWNAYQRLQSIAVSNHTTITDDGTIQLLPACQDLKSLYLVYANTESSELQDLYSTSLKSLTVAVTEGKPQFNFKNTTNLHKLTLKNCSIGYGMSNCFPDGLKSLRLENSCWTQ
ncbi:unnamed protein product [Ambrosiozyma monospora]|uniref:Unnamed protein product n=1 Tax=Ambrosiozyma monospora TaxID=43982 RepID=A0ACB5THZ6_AMBMO|nr:unnamed protein product [Ambrosiozyma monospora]